MSSAMSQSEMVDLVNYIKKGQKELVLVPIAFTSAQSRSGGGGGRHGS